MQYLLNQLPFSVRSAFRSFSKNRIYAGMNILGLSVAFTTIILTCAYLYQETSYESFHQKAKRIYRPTYKYVTSNGFEARFARVPVDFINHLPQEIPEVEKLIRFQNQDQKYVRVGEKRFKPKYAYQTDKGVFDVFDFSLLAGDAATALANPNSIVLTESLARTYFSKTDVVGEELVLTSNYADEETIYKVTGVMKDLPVNTHLPIDLLISFTNESERRGWAYVYTLLKKEANLATVEAGMKEFITKYTDPNATSTVGFDFQALPDIHLSSNLPREIKPNGNLFYVKIFFWVSLFVWLIALINFTNLSTALAMSKGKEIGVRQVLGASKSNLIFMSLIEAVVNCLIALLFGAAIAYFIFPWFANLTGIATFPPNHLLIPGMLGLAIVSGLLAGILPALILTSVKLLEVMKRGNNWSMKTSSANLNLKRVMITLQFSAAIILIASAMLANRQFKFINGKNLGLQPDQILAIPQLPDKVKDQYTIFKNRVKALPGVVEVAACMQVPSSEIRDVGPVLVRGGNQDVENAPRMDMQIIDTDFIKMMELELLEGDDFTTRIQLNQVPEFTKEYTVAKYLAEAPRQYLINETAMKQLGWQEPADAIGKEINWSIGSYTLAYGPIAGIIKDYHQESLKNTIDPLVLTVEPLWLGNFLVKLETRELEKTMAGIKGIWNELFPYAFEYKFLDEMFDQLYQQDRVQLKLLSILAFIAIFISFLGMVSLVAYALRRRSRELAIRRVIGADLRNLTTLIGKEYFMVLAVASMIAIPFSYLWVGKWLESFAYRIDIAPVVFFIAVVLVYALMIITIYLQTLKATIDNPINALREE